MNTYFAIHTIYIDISKLQINCYILLLFKESTQHKNTSTFSLKNDTFSDILEFLYHIYNSSDLKIAKLENV